MVLRIKKDRGALVRFHLLYIQGWIYTFKLLDWNEKISIPNIHIENDHLRIYSNEPSPMHGLGHDS